MTYYGEMRLGDRYLIRFLSVVWYVYILFSVPLLILYDKNIIIQGKLSFVDNLLLCQYS